MYGFTFTQLFKNKNKNDASFLVNNTFATASTFWLDNETLGWQKAPKIQIDFQFSEQYNISSVSLNTAIRKAAGVFLPLNIYVFSSLNGKSFSLLGDMMSTAPEGSDLYKKIKLSLSGFNTTAKYLRLVVVPGGTLFFTDEVQIFKSNGGLVTNTVKKVEEFSNMDDSAVNKLIATNATASINKTFLLKDVKLFTDLGNKNLNKLKQDINKEASITDLENTNYKKGIYKALLNNNGNASISVTQLVSPWENRTTNLKTLLSQKGNSSISKNILTAVSATEYSSFIVSNNTNNNANINFSWVDNDRQLAVYDAQEVKTRDFQTVNDVLMPINNDNTLSLSPGEFKTIMISVNPQKPGKFSDKIILKNGSSQSSITINTTAVSSIMNFEVLKKTSINAWAYVNYPFYKDIKSNVHDDLVNHYVNTVVVPSTVAFPGLNDPGYNKLKGYLANYKGFKKILLFTDLRPYVTKQKDFLTDAWKKTFLQWYDDVTAIIKQGEL